MTPRGSAQNDGFLFWVLDLLQATSYKLPASPRCLFPIFGVPFPVALSKLETQQTTLGGTEEMGVIPVLEHPQLAGWKAFMAAHSILGPELEKLAEIVTLYGARRLRTQKGFDDWFGGAYDEIYGHTRLSHIDITRTFEKSVRDARYGESEMSKYYLAIFHRELEPESRGQNTYRPDSLLERIGQSLTGDNPFVLLEAFNCLTRFIAARLLLDVGEYESEIDLGRQMEEEIGTLFGRLMKPKSKRELVISLDRDLEAPYGIRRVRLNGGAPPDDATRLQLINRPARILLALNGREVPVLFGDRAKRDWVTFLKMLRKMADFRQEEDRRGLRIIALYPRDVPLICSALDAACGTAPLRVRDIEDNTATGSRLDAANPHSSPDFRFVRYKIECDDSQTERPFATELNVVELEQYLLDDYTVHPGRHDRYRLRQIAEGYCPFRWPTAIYGIDWSLGGPDVTDAIRVLDDCRAAEIEGMLRVSERRQRR